MKESNNPVGGKNEINYEGNADLVFIEPPYSVFNKQ